MTAMLPRDLLHPILRRALAEDIGPGDVTTEAVLNGDERGRACAIAKSELVVAGAEVFREVFSLVDAWDALTTDRPYRAKMTPVDALGEITSQSGQQFDPRLVDIFRQFIQLRYLGMQ